MVMTSTTGKECESYCSFFVSAFLFYHLSSNTIHVGQVYELMRRCWENTPERRITFKRLVEELTTMQQQEQPQNNL